MLGLFLCRGVLLQYPYVFKSVMWVIECGLLEVVICVSETIDVRNRLGRPVSHLIVLMFEENSLY